MRRETLARWAGAVELHERDDWRWARMFLMASAQRGWPWARALSASMALTVGACALLARLVLP